MLFQLGEKCHGFYVEECQELADVHSEGVLFRHEKSGARLLYLKSEDDNKVFSITFKTPPKDDCGTPHILEHSVLCGSKKYQAKDPFNELAKGSLNTYLNALTYGDKTMYPVASRNKKDFMNMMDVYLDAVFHPKIYDHKEIFMQEGWHYEYDEKSDALAIGGVVYNEMKGAISDPERILANAIARSLFPDSIYRFESGGDPKAIPELTYEDFLDFHKTCYHPSNSYIYLYGDMDIEECLEFLDQEYLAEYSVSTDLPQIGSQPPFSEAVTCYDTYPVGKGEGEKENTFLAYSTIVGKSTDPKRILAYDILSYILLDTNASPLKKALVNAGIGTEAEGWFDSSTYDMVFSIVVKKAEKEKLPDFQKIIEETLQDIIKNGLDEKLVEASLNRFEFHLREENYGSRPKGLTYGMKVMKSWLHDADPKAVLCHWKQFAELKEDIAKGVFYQMIKEDILENTHKSMLAVSPEEGKETRDEETFQQALVAKKEALTPEEKDTMIAEEKALLAYQQIEELPEVLAQIPTLSLDEVEEEPSLLPTRTEKKNGIEYLFTPQETNGILYIQLLFDTKTVPQEKLPYLGLLAEVLGKQDTKKYSYHHLPMEINFYTGGMGCSFDVYSVSPNAYSTVFSLNGKVMEKNIKEFLALAKDILYKTDFTVYENLKKLVKSTHLKYQNYLTNYAHMAAAVRSLAAISIPSHIKEETSGIHFYQFLKEQVENLEVNIEGMAQELADILRMILTRDGLKVAILSGEEEFTSFVNQADSFFLPLPEKGEQQEVYSFANAPEKTAFTSASKVQYNALSGNFLQMGYEYTGTLQVVKTLLDREYLWNKVRIQGGAYGSGCNFLKNGSAYFYSYRDPNTKKTFDAYAASCDFLRNFTPNQLEMTRFILGAINALDRPLTNKEKADLAIARQFCQITPDVLKKERKEILETSETDLQSCIPLLEEIIALSNICTVGNEGVLEQNHELFQEINPFI